MTTRHYRSDDGISGYAEGDRLIDDTTGDRADILDGIARDGLRVRTDTPTRATGGGR